MRSGYRSSSQNGFTLIELVVAFTLLGLVALVAFSGLNVSLASWSRGNEATDRLREEESFSLMAEQLRSALPMVTLRWSDLSTLAFSGTGEAIEFVANYSMVDGPNSAPRWVQMSVQRTPGSNTAQLRISEHRILPPDNLPETEPYWIGEMPEREAIAFRFLRRDPDDGSLEWLPSWVPVEEEDLPLAVAIRVAPGPRGDVWTRIIPLDSSLMSRNSGGLF